MTHPRRHPDGARQAPSPEFALVAACCVWPPSDERNAAVAAASAGVDWRRVLAVAARQRVEGQLHDGLARAGVRPPAEIAQALRGLAESVARDSLRHAAESVRLQRLLDAAGVANLVLKGAAVEVLAYGGLGMKTAWDIDLLVAPDQADEALRVLEAEGYALTEPVGLAPEQFAVWADLMKECELRHGGTGVVVELHWRLVDGASLLPSLSVGSPSQVVALSPGLDLRTLATDELAAYLCVHGALHGWARLKWLADVAAILARETPDGVERLYRRAVALGAGLCPAQALLLCERLLGARLPPGLAAELHGRKTVRWLEGVALWAMALGDADIRLRDGPMAALPIALSHFALGGTARHARRTAAQKWISVHDRTRIPLPRGLHPLYAVMRGPLWLWRRIGKRA